MKIKLKFARIPSTPMIQCKHYVGYIFVRFDELVSLLGQPSEPINPTSDFLWKIMIGKTIIEIYDFRQRRIHPFLMKKWHVRGESVKAYKLITRFLKERGIDTRRNHSFILQRERIPGKSLRKLRKSAST